VNAFEFKLNFIRNLRVKIVRFAANTYCRRANLEKSWNRGQRSLQDSANLLEQPSYPLRRTSDVERGVRSKGEQQRVIAPIAPYRSKLLPLLPSLNSNNSSSRNSQDGANRFLSQPDPASDFWSCIAWTFK